MKAGTRSAVLDRIARARGLMVGRVVPGQENAKARPKAVESAKSYLRSSSFSRQGLIEQLEYEGFTHSQAAYGVRKAYR
jgi:hypothetical protein